MNKKYLPFIGVIVLAVLFVGVVFVIRKINQPAADTSLEQVDESVPDLTQDQWPTVALIPSSDGHTLDLKINNIKVPGASAVEYLLEWTANNTGTATTQGTSGTAQLSGQTSVERNDLLLGSESSGKKRFDKGVENGKLTLRFRDANGKLLGKVQTDWHMQTGTKTLTSVDKSFTYTLSSMPTNDVWFITINPFATPDPSTVVVYKSPWAIYASDGKPHAGS